MEIAIDKKFVIPLVHPNMPLHPGTLVREVLNPNPPSLTNGRYMLEVLKPQRITPEAFRAVPLFVAEGFSGACLPYPNFGYIGLLSPWVGKALQNQY